MVINDIKRIVSELNQDQKRRFKELGYTNNAFFENGELTKENTFNFKEKKKYIYIDCDNSGYFMINKENGEIFGVKAYGTINKSKFYGLIESAKGDHLLKAKQGGYY